MADPYHSNNFFSGVPYCKARHNLARKPQLYGALTEKEPKLLSVYPDCKLHYSYEEGKEIMEKWNLLPNEEKKKFHW